MAIIGKLAKLAYKMTPKRKAALAKAVAASAKKRAAKKGASVVAKKGGKAVAKKVASKSSRVVKAAGRKTGKVVRKTGRAAKAASKTRLGAAVGVTAAGAGVEKATRKKANSKRNRSTAVARINQISGAVKNTGLKAGNDLVSLVKNTAKVAVGKQSKTTGLANIYKDVAASKLKITKGLAQGQLNVLRARQNKKKKK
jgi:hypothetical protein